MSEADPPGASATEATRWLGKASDDLAIPRVVTSTPDLPRWPACFHAQQAAEKALKAYLVAAGIEFPFTHALDRLADLVEADGFELDRSTMVTSSRGPSPAATPRTYPSPAPTRRSA